MVKESAAALLDKPIEISISWNQSIHFFSFSFRKKKALRTFYICPPYLGTLIQITEPLEKIDSGMMTLPKITMESIYQVAEKYSFYLATITGLAIQNNKELLPEANVRELEANIKPHELSQLFSSLAEMIDVSRFYDFYQLQNKRDPDDDQTDNTSKSRTLWGAIGGMIKYFRFSWNEVLWEISYRNILMLSATIPVYKSKKEKKAATEDVQDRELNSGEDLASFLGLKI